MYTDYYFSWHGLDPKQTLCWMLQLEEISNGRHQRKPMTW